MPRKAKPPDNPEQRLRQRLRQRLEDDATIDAIADALITAATGASKGYAGDIIKAYDRISEIIRDPTDQLRGDLEDAELARTSTADLLAMWRALDN